MAVGPIDYSIGAPDPFASVMGGMESGLAMRKIQDDRAKLEEQKLRKQAMSEDIAKTFEGNPTAKDYARLSTMYPEFNEQFKESFGKLSAEKQAVKIEQLTDVTAALQRGDTDTAKKILESNAIAAENSGNKASADAAKAMSKYIDLSPESALGAVSMRLAAAIGPEQFEKVVGTLGGEKRAEELQESTKTKAEAEAKTAKSKAEKAAVAAGFEKSLLTQKLAKGGWDISKIKSDIKTQEANTKISALKVAQEKTNNDLKRQELQQKIDEVERKRDKEIRETVASVETTRSTIDNFTSTLDRILATPINTMRSAMGPFAQRMPTLSQETADFEALIDSVDAQAFVSQMENAPPGALSEAEGTKLAKALQNFSLVQSPESLIRNVKEAQRLLQKSRTNLSKKYGVPDTIPDTPNVEADDEEKQALLNKYVHRRNNRGQYGGGE